MDSIDRTLTSQWTYVILKSYQVSHNFWLLTLSMYQSLSPIQLLIVVPGCGALSFDLNNRYTRTHWMMRLILRHMWTCIWNSTLLFNFVGVFILEGKFVDDIARQYVIVMFEELFSGPSGDIYVCSSVS